VARGSGIGALSLKKAEQGDDRDTGHDAGED